MLISGYDGGTGAAPRNSIYNAGLPWELGLAETHQTLIMNGLRSKVVIETDGKLMTGRDVLVAALLGAEEYGFATAPLVTMGCVMMRVCNLDTCPVGIATQNPELRKRFKGKPEYIINFMHFIAQELREYMARLGIRTVDELVGRSDLLVVKETEADSRESKLDLTQILNNPYVNTDAPRTFVPEDVYDFELEKTVDERVILKKMATALKNKTKRTIEIEVTNTDRSVGTIFGSEITKRYHDNTLEDLKALNGNSLDITYNDAGEITFLSGKYTDYKVINAETAMSSLQAVESILNAKENDISLIPINVKTADNGDKYFTFQQIVGAVVLQNAFITVGADKDGNTLCISSSIQPKAGVKDLEENMLTAEQAFEKALSAAEETVGCTLEKADKEPELDYMMYSKLGTSNLCWVVYFKQLAPTEQDPEKSKYVKVYIDASSGELENLLYLSSLEDYRTSEDVYDNDVYFKGVTTEIKTFTNYLGNKVELPVAKTDSGTYYFIDTERKMVCADTSKVEPIEYRQMIPYEFASPEEVSPIFVSVFDNMRRIYDKYAEKGIRSLNGNGLPIMICLGYQQYGQEIENACFAGDYFGWGVFMFSKFPISTGLDVAAHEFTHGIKGNITGIVAYQNTTGAIEESYADILGNLTEMLIDPENSDTEQWLMGESTGKVIRSMSDPHAYAQPEYVGDAYYLMECDTPGELNDRGGVHINNSVLSKICYEMYKSGISMEEDYDIWLNTFLVLNPNASFDDVLGYVKYSAVRSGKEQYLDIIQQLFENGKAVNAQTDSWEGYPVPEGYAKIKLVAHDFPEGVDWGAAVINGTKQVLIYKDKTETYSTILDKANVILLIRYKDDPNAAPNAFFCLPMNQEGYNLKIDKDEVVVEFSYNDLVSTKKN